MADRYWVGGNGNWDTTDGTKWATTSGGTGGASKPTSTDNVFFDSASGAVTVYITAAVVCANLTCTGFTGTLASTGQLAVGGNLVFSPTMTVSHTGTLLFNGSGTGKTIDFAGLTKANGPITFNGSSEWTLLSDITLSSPGTSPDGTTITLTTGTLNTNGYTLSFGRFAATGGTLNLGSSTLNCTSYNTIWSVAAGVTVNAGTSTLNISVLNWTNTSAFVGASKTYYNVNIIGTLNQLFNITGANTFSTLSITAPTSTTYTKPVTFDSTQTIGTLTTSGTTAAYRVELRSSVAGTQRTLSVASIGTLTNTNFKDIALTGAASPWTAPLGVWNLGNNSGITFDTTTLYWVGGGGSWTDGTHWATSSGGSAAGVQPGPTNSIVFDTNSGTGTITPSGNIGYCNNITSTVTQTLGFNTSTLAVNIYGNLDYSGAGGGWNYGYYLTTVFVGTGTGKTVNFNGGSANNVQFNGPGSEWTLTGDIYSNSGNGVTITAGTVITNNYRFAPIFININGTLARGLYLGSSLVNNTRTFNVASSTNFSYDFSSSSITLSYVGGAQQFFGAGLNYNNVTIGGVDARYFASMTGANTFNNLTILGKTALSADQTVTGTFTVTGTNETTRVVIASDTFGTQRTITAAATSLSYVDFYGVNGAGDATWSGTSIGDATLNSGITFTAPKTVYWSLASGGNWNSTAWATSSGGTPAVANYPLPQDTAIIENTGLNTSATITVPAVLSNNTYYPIIDFSTRTNAMTFSMGNNTVMCGNITLGSGVTLSGTGSATFLGSTTLTSAGKTWTAPITVATGATMTTADAFSYNNVTTGCTVNGALTLNADATITNQATTSASVQLNGTLNLNSYTLSVRNLYFGSAAVANFGTGKVLLRGYSGTVFLGSNTQTVTGSAVIDVNPDAASNGTTLAAASPTEANTISFNVLAAAYSAIVNIGGNVKNIDFTGFSGTLGNSARTIYGSLTLSSGMTLTGGANATTFAATSGTKTITTNGKTLDFPITFNGVGGTWQLADNLTQGSGYTTTLTNGTLDLNGKTYTVGSFATAAGTKNLTFNAGTLSVPAVTTTAFNNAQPANFTTTAGTGTGKISMTGATAKTFVGGGSVYNCTIEQAGAGALTITGSNTFNDIDNTVQPVSVLFTAGTTNTFNNFSLNGTSGNLVTIGSVTAASHTLSKASGIVDVSYCSISRSTATGGARWQAYTTNGNVNAGNNSGWKFSAFSGNGLFFGSNF